jgi:hypothetical protein
MSLSAHDTGYDDDSEREPVIEHWCRGCRLAGDRPLSEAERSWLKWLRTENAWRLLRGLAPVPVGIALTAAESALTAGSTLTWLVGATGFLTIGVLLPVSIVLVRDSLRAWRDCGRDLARGTAWEFEAPAGDARIPREGARAFGFALLPSSRRVANPADSRLSLFREEITDVPPFSGVRLYAPLSLQVTEHAPGAQFEQRPLSAPEREELARVARRLRLPPTAAVLAAVMLAVILTMLDSLGPQLARAPITDFISIAVAAALCVRALARFARGFSLATRIGEDLRLGLVVHVVHPERSPQEFLPASRLVWRVAEAPAAWRDQRRAPQRLRAGL